MNSAEYSAWSDRLRAYVPGDTGLATPNRSIFRPVERVFR